VLESLIDMVNRRDLAFDWFDAPLCWPSARAAFGQRIEGLFAEEGSVRLSAV
jgi:hypothetical protein